MKIDDFLTSSGYQKAPGHR